MLTPRDIEPVAIAGILLLLLIAGSIVVSAPPAVNQAISDRERITNHERIQDHERIECWSLESSFMDRNGWIRAHRADKLAQRRGVDFTVSPSPDTVCDVLDADGLPRRELRARFWWIRPGATP